MLLPLAALKSAGITMLVVALTTVAVTAMYVRTVPTPILGVCVPGMPPMQSGHVHQQGKDLGAPKLVNWFQFCLVLID